MRMHSKLQHMDTRILIPIKPAVIQPALALALLSSLGLKPQISANGYSLISFCSTASQLPMVVSFEPVCFDRVGGFELLQIKSLLKTRALTIYAPLQTSCSSS